VIRQVAKRAANITNLYETFIAKAFVPVAELVLEPVFTTEVKEHTYGNTKHDE
jgi:hypothetical protein